MAGEHYEQAAALLAMGFGGVIPPRASGHQGSGPNAIEYEGRVERVRMLGIEEAKVHALLHLAERIDALQQTLYRK